MEATKCWKCNCNFLPHGGTNEPGYTVNSKAAHSETVINLAGWNTRTHVYSTCEQWCQPKGCPGSPAYWDRITDPVEVKLNMGYKWWCYKMEEAMIWSYFSTADHPVHPASTLRHCRGGESRISGAWTTLPSSLPPALSTTLCCCSLASEKGGSAVTLTNTHWSTPTQTATTPGKTCCIIRPWQEVRRPTDMHADQRRDAGTGESQEGDMDSYSTARQTEGRKT